MTGSPDAGSGLVRITVISDQRRVDLAVPLGALVADLVPELARRVGILDRVTAHDGYRAVTRTGRVLRPDAALGAQGVEHGDVLAISPRDDDLLSPVYDDGAEAIAHLAGEVGPWQQWMRGPTTLVALTALLLASAPLLLVEHGRASAAWFGAALAGLLLVGAVLVSRLRSHLAGAVTVAHLAGIHAGVAGLCWGWRGSLDGTALVLAGSGVMVTALSAALTVAQGRLLMLPAVVIGGLLGTAGLLRPATGLPAGPFLTGLLTVVVLASGGLPRLALGATGAGRHVAIVAGDVGAVVASGIDLERLSGDVRAAREILVSASAAAGSLLVVLAPVAVAQGPGGFLVPVLGSGVVMLRTRRCRAAVDVLLGIGSGVMGVVSTLVALLFLADGWRWASGAVVAVVGVLLLACTLLPPIDEARRGRLGDIAERILLGALVPALLVAVGPSLGRPGT